MWVRIPPGLPRTTVGNSGTGEPLKLEMRVRVSRGALRSVAQFGRALGPGPRGSQVQILSLRREETNGNVARSSCVRSDVTSSTVVVSLLWRTSLVHA